MDPNSGTNPTPPPVVAKVLARAGAGTSKIHYSRLMRLAIREYVARNQKPAARGMGLDATASQGAALSEDEVLKALAEKLRSLAGARPPANLTQEIEAQNIEAARARLSAPPRVQLGMGQANQPSPTQARLDWRDKGLVVQDSGIVTAVKDQGTCGCCWAFATIAAVEAAFARDNLELIEGSEQYLLDNAREYLANASQPYTCEGGWWAFDMLVPGAIPSLGTPGVPTGATLPYAPPGGPIAVNFALPYKLQTWGYVTPSDPSGLPTGPDLKAALCQKGPLAVGVNVPIDPMTGSAVVAWMGNQGEPLGDFANDPAQSINHVVLLVGWDDTVTASDGSRGAWIIKNSWGEWGIPLPGTTTGSGFAYVKYGCNNLGLGAAWVTPAAP